MSNFLIRGTVIDAETGVPVPDVFVEIWDSDRLYDDLLGTARTTEDGRFALPFTSDEPAPDLYFKVMSDRLLYHSSGDVFHDVETGRLEVTLPVSIRGPGDPPVLLSTTKADHVVLSELGNPVDEADFGRAFYALVFTSEALARRVARTLPPHRTQVERRTVGPIVIEISADTNLGQPNVRPVGTRTFDVVVPVSTSVRLVAELGPVEPEESFAVLARVAFRLTVHLFDSLKIYVEASRVEPDLIAIKLARTSWTGLSKGTVEAELRRALADEFNASLGTPEIVDVLARAQEILLGA